MRAATSIVVETQTTEPPWWSRPRRLALLLAILLIGVGALVTLDRPRPPIVPYPLPVIAIDDYTSFFDGTALEGTGWMACPEPITWSVDVGSLDPLAKRKEISRLRLAFGQWAQESGLRMEFTGREALDYDASTHALNPADGSPPRDRHVYIGFLEEGESPLFVDSVVGLAMPSRVLVSRRAIVTGVIAIRSSYVSDVRRVEPRYLRHLYLHEIGHTMGLGHAELKINVMEPTVRIKRILGPGDVTGVRAMLRPCVATPRSPTTGR